MTGGFEHCFDDFRRELSRARLAAHELLRRFGRMSGTMRPRLAHRLVRVGDSEDAGVKRNRAAG
jgi:hypothetical protein